MRISIVGRMYYQIGSITMDFTLIWLGEDKIPLSIPVFLLDGQQLRADVWAEKTQTIAYEITTGISPKVPRVYID